MSKSKVLLDTQEILNNATDFALILFYYAYLTTFRISPGSWICHPYCPISDEIYYRAFNFES